MISETCQVVAFSCSWATLRATRSDRPGQVSGRPDLVARRVARLWENASILTCSAQQIVEGIGKREEVEEEKGARHNFSEAKPKVLRRSRKRNF